MSTGRGGTGRNEVAVLRWLAEAGEVERQRYDVPPGLSAALRRCIADGLAAQGASGFSVWVTAEGLALLAAVDGAS